MCYFASLNRFLYFGVILKSQNERLRVLNSLGSYTRVFTAVPQMHKISFFATKWHGRTTCSFNSLFQAFNLFSKSTMHRTFNFTELAKRSV